MARPRIRTLKPEHTLNPKIGHLSDRAYRLWVAMICNADDEGRGIYRAEELRALVYAYQPRVKRGAIEEGIGELEKADLVVVYEADGRGAFQLHDWAEHQRVDHPTASKIPPPPADSRALTSPHEDARGIENPRAGSDRDRDRTGSDQNRTGRGHGPGMDGFQEFWEAFPKKVARAAALRAWKKLSPSRVLQEQMIRALELHKASDQWRKDNGAFIPHAATWINGGRWEDQQTWGQGGGDEHGQLRRDARGRISATDAARLLREEARRIRSRHQAGAGPGGSGGPE